MSDGPDEPGHDGKKGDVRPLNKLHSARMGLDPGIPPARKRAEDHEPVLEGLRKAGWAAEAFVKLPVLAFTFFVRNYLVSNLMTGGVKE